MAIFGEVLREKILLPFLWTLGVTPNSLSGLEFGVFLFLETSSCCEGGTLFLPSKEFSGDLVSKHSVCFLGTLLNLSS